MWRQVQCCSVCYMEICLAGACDTQLLSCVYYGVSTQRRVLHLSWIRFAYLSSPTSRNRLKQELTPSCQAGTRTDRAVYHAPCVPLPSKSSATNAAAYMLWSVTTLDCALMFFCWSMDLKDCAKACLPDAHKLQRYHVVAMGDFGINNSCNNSCNVI